jgi:hypothetical protein
MNNPPQYSMKSKKSERFWIRWRKRLKSWLVDYQWPLIGTIALFVLALGYVGFKKLCAFPGEQRSTLDAFYLSLQLFVLEFDPNSRELPLELEFARWLAPAVAAYAAVKALAAILRDQFQALRLKFISDHVVICGLGRKGVLYCPPETVRRLLG